MRDLEIEVVHRIPGRLRLRLHRPPRSVNDFIVAVTRHAGLEAVRYTPLTKSLLISYNPSVVSSTEIIVRVGIALSLDYENRGVEITKLDSRQKLTVLDYYAASSLALATVGRAVVLAPTPLRILDYNAGFSTLAAVLRHAWSEVAREGIYDPEVISVVYLVNSMLKGNFLLASVITWIATFGRHLIAQSQERCFLEASEVIDDTGNPYVDVMVRPIYERGVEKNPLKLVVVSLSRLVGLNPKRGVQTMFEQVQQMSRKHGNVLEGVGKTPAPVYMRLNT